MLDAPADVPQQKTRGRPFQKGQCGNPGGRPKGTRHHATLLAERLMESDVPDVVRAVVDAAKGGDMTACKFILERIVPIRRGRPILIDLPAINCAQDLVNAAGRVVDAVASGELTTEEGAALVSVVDFQRRAIESSDFESRLMALEKVDRNVAP